MNKVVNRIIADAITGVLYLCNEDIALIPIVLTPNFKPMSNSGATAPANNNAHLSLDHVGSLYVEMMLATTYLELVSNRGTASCCGVHSRSDSIIVRVQSPALELSG